MNLKEIKDLIELVSDKGFAEFEIERQGFRLRVSRFREPAPQAIQPAATPVIISSSVPGASELLSPVAQRGLIGADSSSSGSSKAASPSAKVEPAETESELHTIKSPIVGTFYRSPSPTSDAFVKIGDHVEPDTVVCIIEAMKLMNEIQAEVSGEIVKIFIENGQPVEYGQVLFGVKAVS
ncbi:MAG: acetyl-CoA carboxylase biotin carboxyl carrier protein [Blastocatellia bacterium]